MLSPHCFTHLEVSSQFLDLQENISENNLKLVNKKIILVIKGKKFLGFVKIENTQTSVSLLVDINISVPARHQPTN